MSSGPPIEAESSKSTEKPFKLNTSGTSVTEHPTRGWLPRYIVHKKRSSGSCGSPLASKGYADFIASDDDFFNLRRFGTLIIRVALSFQDEISELEQRLEECDATDDLPDSKELLEFISDKISCYNAFILQQSLVRKSPSAPRRDIKSTRNWHCNHDYGAIYAKEQEYLNHTDDLICIVHEDKTPLRQLVDSSLRLRTLGLWRDKRTDVPFYDAGNVGYFSEKRLHTFASAFIVAVGVAMLITPIWILCTAGFRLTGD